MFQFYIQSVISFPLLTDTDLPLNPQQTHKAFVVWWHVVWCVSFDAAESDAWRTLAQCLWKYHLFVLLQDIRRPEKTHKSLAFLLCLWHLQGQKHRGGAAHQRLVPKTFSDWTVTTVPHKTPFYLSPPRSAAEYSAGQFVDRRRDAEPITEGRGIQQPWCTCVSHNWMCFRMKTQGCHYLMWFILCKQDLPSGYKQMSFLIKEVLVWSKAL